MAPTLAWRAEHLGTVDGRQDATRKASSERGRNVRHGVSRTTSEVCQPNSMGFMSSIKPTPLQLTAFIGAVVIGTTVVILLMHWITGSWAVGATAGAIAGVLSTAMYPVSFRRQ